MNSVKDLLLKYSSRYEQDEFVREFVNYFKNRFGDNLVYVIFYGSCLHASTRKSTSMYDFYLVVEDYKKVYSTFDKRKRFYRFLNRILPPNVYFLYLTVNGSKVSAKYNIISLNHFDLYTSDRAPDMYVFGRLGKRVVLLYTRSAEEAKRFAGMWERAMRMNASLALYFLPPRFDVESFIKWALKVSYMGDYRVERDTKVDELFEADAEFYREVYSLILDDFIAEGKVKKVNGSFEKIDNALGDSRKVEKFIKRAKRRSIYRWPKGLMTVDDYVEYLINKVERAKGIRIELSPLERKFPLILGWKYFFKLKRRGMIK